jgi:hypothetical protein
MMSSTSVGTGDGEGVETAPPAGVGAGDGACAMSICEPRARMATVSQVEILFIVYSS